jgi:uncharacterized protein CbrC (UPF0167 family)
MDVEAVPAFRYYRDPFAEEAIRPAATKCSACGRARGYIVTSVAYGPDVPDDAKFCPWCVADGTAHESFGVTFNEVELGASPEATAEVSERTPGIFTWQDWSWPTHCNDVGVYVGQPSGDDRVPPLPRTVAALGHGLTGWRALRKPS